jgi:hypothetical protein
VLDFGIYTPLDIGPSAHAFCSRSPAPNSEFLLGAAGLVFLDLDLDFSHRFVQGDIGQRAWFLFCPRTRFYFPVPVAAQLEFAIS